MPWIVAPLLALTGAATARGELAIEVRPDAGLRPEIRVHADVGATCVIESKNELGAGHWLARAVLEMTSSTEAWLDPVPVGGSGRFYRSTAVTKPAVEPLADMVWIPAGTFTMGSPEDEAARVEWEGPQTVVTLSQGFWMSRYEVTQRQYQDLMGTNPSFFSDDPDRPVEQVSWNDAQRFCERLTAREIAAGRISARFAYRLPTEAQWEYACRAGTTTRYSFGDDPDSSRIGAHAWTASNSRVAERPPGISWESEDGFYYQTSKVGQKLPNPWGLHDLHGNVYEWCRNRWELYPGGTVSDPTGPASGAFGVMRGGGWRTDKTQCRSAFRYGIGIFDDDAREYLGFRVVLVLTLVP